jgi:hypothetical protein
LESRVVHLGEVALQVGQGLRHLGLLLGQRRLHLAERRAIPGHVGFHLADRGLQGPLIDGKEQVALGHLLAFLEVHLDDLTSDLCLEPHRRVGLNVADRDHLEWHRPPLRRGHSNRHRRRRRRARLGVARAVRASGGEE